MKFSDKILISILQWNAFLLPVTGLVVMLGPSVHSWVNWYSKAQSVLNDFDYYENISHLLSAFILLLSFASIIIFPLMFIGIRREDFSLLRIYGFTRFTLYFLINCVYSVKYEMDGKKQLRPLWAHFLYVFYMWLYGPDTLALLKCTLNIKRRKGIPVRETMLGIRLETLVKFQIGVSWMSIPYTIFANWVHWNIPELRPYYSTPGFLASTIGASGAFIFVAPHSYFLYRGFKKRSVKLIERYCVQKMGIFMVFTTCWYIFMRQRNEILKTPSPFWTNIYELIIGLLFLFELVELLYYTELLRQKKLAMEETKDILKMIDDVENTNSRMEFSYPGGADRDDIEILLQEVKVQKVKVELDRVIGKGEFGTVWKGKLLKTGILCCLNESIPVAVKLLKPNGDKKYHEMVVSEIKTLAKVKDHDNLVKFHGVCWNVNEINLGIVMEFCAPGTLLSHLRQMRKCGKDVGTDDLVQMDKWALEIALAMDYLGQIKVVHGDLASRNVLLTGNKIAKVSDFGMSLRLYNYQLHATSNQSVFPWRWMAPESLSDLKFSQKSDVWSYAVTLWEIYTLGEVPWHGLMWSSDFLDKLREGLTLEKPKYASDTMYELIMRRCWHIEETLRLDFADIKDHFQVTFF